MDYFFSVIIPTFNRAEPVKKAIESLLRQNFDNFEIIVVDDGSEDNTESVLSPFVENGLKYFKQSNRGVCAARNFGVKHAVGKFLIFLDSDDYLGKGALLEYHRCLQCSPAKLLLGYSAFETSSGQQIGRILPWRNGFDFGHPLTGAFAIERNLFLELGGYDENLFFSETSDLFLRLSMEKKIAKEELVLTEQGGVHVLQGDRATRNQRYSLRKYQSIKYFLEKHKTFFDVNPMHYLNFKRLHGMGALQNRYFGEARNCFWAVLKKSPFQWKSYFHFFFVLMIPNIARRYYYGK